MMPMITLRRRRRRDALNSHRRDRFHRVSKQKYRITSRFFLLLSLMCSLLFSLSLKQSGELRCALSAHFFFFCVCVHRKKSKKDPPHKKRVVWLKKSLGLFCEHPLSLSRLMTKRHQNFNKESFSRHFFFFFFFKCIFRENLFFIIHVISFYKSIDNTRRCLPARAPPSRPLEFRRALLLLLPRRLLRAREEAQRCRFPRSGRFPLRLPKKCS